MKFRVSLDVAPRRPNFTMSELGLIKKALEPFKKDIPFMFRGAFDKMVTHEKVKELYEVVGGEGGVRKLADAIIAIGKSEVIGLP